ncbi:hypothetical protein ABGB17_25900 [Sphaerisporangium sp. B11E5]|uniref:hypothetical protein n=1 Tax=Sphaerisporangium sp. B11E5 TaxID=3153563 RepID=UPI00325CA289
MSEPIGTSLVRADALETYRYRLALCEPLDSNHDIDPPLDGEGAQVNTLITSSATQPLRHRKQALPDNGGLCEPAPRP